MLKATITPDARHVDLRGKHWSETFPVERLPEKIALYESLRDRKGGAYARHYAPTVRSLRAAQKIHQTLTTKRKEPTT